ncbi:MAG: DUF2852 domain-containing protein [Hyphomicrobiaceae bacterium]|nr:DUF2852 domain-containing protein [Hyphomicrobiaceae bacterium]MCC0023892.1 DUF2852 domain-containing protein [Hyphomicrobiaceae bacterium]
MSTAIIKPQWSFVTILLMVLGFVFFWPLGLGMLAYILWGEMFGGSADKAEAFINRQRENFRSHAQNRNRYSRHSSGNAAFDFYREEQLKRLDEERRRLDDEVREFREYMDNLAKARDREEFDRFMRERRQNAGQYESPFDQNDNRQGY